MHGLIEGVGELKVCRMFGIQVAKCLQDCLHAHEAVRLLGNVVEKEVATLMVLPLMKLGITPPCASVQPPF